jgi:NADH:ubiquinone oxidoreductase subunit 6 (subunit J)
MHYSVEIVNKELLQAVLSGQITQDEAKALLAKMRAKRKRGLIHIAMCPVVILATVIIVVAVAWGTEALKIKIPETVDSAAFYFAVLGVFGPFFAFAFALNSVLIARQYIKALKLGYPQVF